MNFVYNRKWYNMVVIIVGVIENDKVGVVKKYRDNLMYKSVKPSAINPFAILGLPYRIFHIYYSSNTEMGQISALIFPKF